MVLSMDRWIGKVALVTGASAGIGAAIVDALLAHDIIVVGLARRVNRIEEKARRVSKGKLYSVQADLTKEEEILEAFTWVKENVGPIHIFINNAGYFAMGSVSEGKTEEWRKIFDTNVIATCIATREAVKSMKENGVDGHIIHMNSITGHKVPEGSGGTIYPASKHALRAISEILRNELTASKCRIKITSISPGLTESEMTTLNPNMPPELESVLTERPILLAEDIADAVIYVLSTPPRVQIRELTIVPHDEP